MVISIVILFVTKRNEKSSLNESNVIKILVNQKNSDNQQKSSLLYFNEILSNT